jgi:hypothetical protein
MVLAAGRGGIGEQNRQRGLEKIVVEGAAELGPEEGGEAPGFEQGPLTAVGFWVGADGNMLGLLEGVDSESIVAEA